MLEAQLGRAGLCYPKEEPNILEAEVNEWLFLASPNYLPTVAMQGQLQLRVLCCFSSVLTEGGTQQNTDWHLVYWLGSGTLCFSRHCPKPVSWPCLRVWVWRGSFLHSFLLQRNQLKIPFSYSIKFTSRLWEVVNRNHIRPRCVSSSEGELATLHPIQYV